MTEFNSPDFNVGTQKISAKKKLKIILDSFSPKQTFAFLTLFIILLVSALSILSKINKTFLVYLPERGGSLTEGLLGAPRFINPILAISDTDRDITTLVYSGLMKKTPDGLILPDLAESYTVSPDGLTYTFVIRSDAKFQDKEPVKPEDVIFTIEKVKDSMVRSPLQSIWQGVSVSSDANQENSVIFRLSAPYASFLENTTLGILPKHVWDKLQPEEFNLSKNNLEAIGSGAYKIKDVKQNKNGLVEEFRLTQWSGYSGDKPFIKKINFVFFKSESDLIKAYRKGRIDQISSISPKSAELLSSLGYEPTTATLGRVFGLFFNPNHNEIFRDKNVVSAINLIINKNKIVDEVLYGFGKVIDSPVPLSLDKNNAQPEKDTPEDIVKAETILTNAGWTLNQSTGFREKGGKKLQFSIATADVGELRQTSELIKQDLAKAGIDVSIKVFETGMLNQSIIRPRDYEALFFGQIIRNDSDLFAFWHSSQRNDPGLNISLYANTKVDKSLEDLISTNDPDIRTKKLSEISDQIKNDMPAIFIYSPEFIYMEGAKVQGVDLERISGSFERFLGIKDWYIRTDAVWKFFIKDETTN
jgi:peptide/nickel transport system substrate-binding protein